MQSTVNYEIHSKEKFYFIIKIIAALAGYTWIYWIITVLLSETQGEVAFVPLFFFVGLIFFYLLFRMGILKAYFMRNAVKVSKVHFPEIHHIVVQQSNLLGLKKYPEVYMLQSDNALNAFGMRFFGANYVVLNADIMKSALVEDLNALKFIIGHELGYIKRNHMTKSVLLLPAIVVPFLHAAYSRACELTCDNIGHALCQEGVRPGLFILARRAFINQQVDVGGYFSWFSIHQRLNYRISRFGEVEVGEIERVVLAHGFKTDPVISVKNEALGNPILK
ncbi:M48 family metallopeptidase [Pedobacter immunditicola]|uniref:M48 family metallopeptidase n=1 Tax=Pedobacter immunditicola TaxID=3133440 RepID=UPI0030AEFDE6